MKPPARFLAAGLLPVLALTPTAPVAAADLKDLPQLTAEPPLRTPATASCTETVLVHTFANSYYQPGYGQHRAASCKGPWAFVALGVEVSVSGVQFDRLFDIYVGHVPMLSSSTSEPASLLPGAVTHWHVDADVSRFAGLLASDQPITAILNNVNDGTYTGQYAVTLTLTYYAAGPGVPAIVPPAFIGALFEPGEAPHADGPGNLGTSGYAGLGANNPRYARSLVLPQNLVSLVADVYAQGHGACEEFWWAEPGQCGTGTPLRQVLLSIDGVVAGFAPVYPVLFTGGGGPGSWNPIPSPRAWHVDPYRLDLTPFVGLLVDGRPHRFTIDVPDAAYSDPGDYWIVGATLLGEVDPRLPRTIGALTAAAVTPLAEGGLSAPQAAATHYTGARDGRWSGYVIGSRGRVDSTVSNRFELRSTSSTVVDSRWQWTTASTTQPWDAVAVTRTVSREYGLVSPGLGGGHFIDTATETVDGPQPFTSNFQLRLNTLGAIDANLAQVETYAGSDSSGYCYERMVSASGGYVTLDRVAGSLPVKLIGVLAGGCSAKAR